MKKKKVRTCKELAYIKVTGSSRAVFKRVIGYTYQQIVSEFVKITGAKTFPEKVTNMVGTFLKKESMIAKVSKNELQKVTCTVGTFIKIEDVKAKISKNELQKVTCMVGTFWKIASVKVKISKNEPQKVTNMVGTFLNEDSPGLNKFQSVAIHFFLIFAKKFSTNNT